MSQETFQQDFAVGEAARLDLSNIRGSVDVQPGEEGVVAITAVKHLDSGDAERTEIEMVQREDGAVTVTTRFPEPLRSLLNRQRPCKVDYTVHLPRNCVLNVRGVSCTVSVQGLQGVFELKTVSGAQSLRNLSGRIKASSVSGEISGEGLAGSADIGEVSGRARLIDSELDKIEATSVSGALEVRPLFGDGPHRFKTVSGRVRLTLPEGAGCTVDYSTLSGKVSTSLPTAGVGKRGKGQIEVRGGGPRVRFSSVSGNLVLETSEGDSPAGEAAGAEVVAPAEAGETVETASPAEAVVHEEVAPAVVEESAEAEAPIDVETDSERTELSEEEVASPESPKTRLEVIERIARGEMTAEDGVVALKALKKAE